MAHAENESTAKTLVAFRIDQGLQDELDALVAAEGENRSSMIRRIIADEVDRHKLTHPEEVVTA